MLVRQNDRKTAVHTSEISGPILAARPPNAFDEGRSINEHDVAAGRVDDDLCVVELQGDLVVARVEMRFDDDDDVIGLIGLWKPTGGFEEPLDHARGTANMFGSIRQV
jgi:hypothetical protein